MPELTQLFFDLLPFIAIGFTAQMIDGALGMAFGVITQTMLVSVMGLPPAVASASVHGVEMFTTAASGTSHIAHKNIDWALFKRLAPFGIIGGVAGATAVSNIDASVARPFVMLYLTGIGIYLLVKAIRQLEPHVSDPKYTAPLAVTGGFLDAAGGGGWGPVVTSNLLVQGGDPRKVIGTVNTTEFLVTTSITIAFVLSLGSEIFSQYANIAAGLIIGGVVAAPFGARIAAKVPLRTLLLAVSLVLIVTSAYNVYRAWPIF
jgi:uncharacterized membrane protein YfcA